MTSFDFSSYSKPSIIGPGTWYMLHLKASDIDSIEDIISLHGDIDRIRRRFSCENCRDHFNEFSQKYSPTVAMEKDVSDFRRNIKPEHLAKWIVMAHNGATKQNYTKRRVSYRPDDYTYESVRDYFNPSGYKPCYDDDCDGDTIINNVQNLTLNSGIATSPIGGGTVILSPRRRRPSPVRAIARTVDAVASILSPRRRSRSRHRSRSRSRSRIVPTVAVKPRKFVTAPVSRIVKRNVGRSRSRSRSRSAPRRATTTKSNRRRYRRS